MDLPQEVVDEVIDNLAFDFNTLKSTSLVRKSWTHRSRRRLFRLVLIHSLATLEQWSQIISPDPDGIASYPRVLRLSPDTSWIVPENLLKFYDHFRSFSQVERLVITGFDAAKFDTTSIPRYFGNFTATVRSLELGTTTGSPASLFSFICAFSLVDDLAIEYPETFQFIGVDQGEVARPQTTPRFKGKLRLLDRSIESLPLIDLLCTLPLPFHTISVCSRRVGGLPQLAKLTSKCGKTVRSLHITKKTHATSLGPTGVSLSSCVALEELRITVVSANHLVVILGEIIPTLPNSSNLSRIVLDADGTFPWDVDVGTWVGLDRVMSERAERISGKRPNQRLTLQFRTNEEGGTGEYDGWARELVRLLALFPKVGNVEYLSKY